MDEKYQLPMYEHTCGPKIPTEEEEEVLAQMRKLKEELRSLKERLSNTVDPVERQGLLARTQQLKCQWNELEKKKEEARIRRMRLLGYD